MKEETKCAQAVEPDCPQLDVFRILTQMGISKAKWLELAEPDSMDAASGE